MINRLSYSRLGNISFIALVTISYFVPRSLRSLVTKYDSVSRAIKLISPRLSYDNLYILTFDSYIGIFSSLRIFTQRDYLVEKLIKLHFFSIVVRCSATVFRLVYCKEICNLTNFRGRCAKLF